MAANYLIELANALESTDAPFTTSLTKYQPGPLVGWEPATHPHGAKVARLVARVIGRLNEAIHARLSNAEHDWHLRALRWDRRPIYDIPKRVVWCSGGNCGER